VSGAIISHFYRLTLLVERMSDAECAHYDPDGLGDPYWCRLRQVGLPCEVVMEGPTYVIAPDVPRLVQVQLSLDGAIASKEIGACEVEVLADHDVPNIDGIQVYVRLELTLNALPDDLEDRLSCLPLKAYRVEDDSFHPDGPDWSLLDHDWSDVLPPIV